MRSLFDRRKKEVFSLLHGVDQRIGGERSYPPTGFSIFSFYFPSANIPRKRRKTAQCTEQPCSSPSLPTKDIASSSFLPSVRPMAVPKIHFPSLPLFPLSLFPSGRSHGRGNKPLFYFPQGKGRGGGGFTIRHPLL